MRMTLFNISKFKKISSVWNYCLDWPSKQNTGTGLHRIIKNGGILLSKWLLTNKMPLNNFLFGENKWKVKDEDKINFLFDSVIL